MNKKIIFAVIGIIIIIALGYLFLKPHDDAAQQPKTTGVNETPTLTPDQNADATVPGAKTVTIELTDTGFSPASITVNAGDTLTFVNKSSGKMWVASAPHPQHTDYPAFNENAASNSGKSWNFTITKAGTWKYHNHLNPSMMGTVTVTVGAKD